MKKIADLFQDKILVKMIEEVLPRLFQIAEIDSSRAGKVGMEVGTVREKILISLLINVFGKEQIDKDISIHKSEVDVKVGNEPISIKTITGLTSFKVVWTVDAIKSKEFFDNYTPKIDILLTIIDWKNKGYGGLYYIPSDVQIDVFNQMDKEDYLHLPKPGTNPRGVDVTKNAVKKMIEHDGTYKIQITWVKRDIDYDTYQRWLKLWQEEIDKIEINLT